MGKGITQKGGNYNEHSIIVHVDKEKVADRGEVIIRKHREKHKLRKRDSGRVVRETEGVRERERKREIVNVREKEKDSK